MRILLTGASGNLGRGVLPTLVAQGHTILAVGRDRARLAAICQPHAASVTPVVCDLAAPGDLPLPEDYDAVVHAAAHATAHDSPDAHVLHNLIALRQLLRHVARRPGRPFVFFSSLSLYGTIRQSVVDEQTPVCDPGSYGASKLLGEYLVREYGTTLAALALRLPGVLGPGARDPWLARVLQTARAGQPVALYTPDTPFNNALQVDDLGRFLGQLLPRLRPGFDALTLGASEPRPLREVVATLLAHLTPPAVLHEVAAPRTPFIISNRRAIEHYGYAPASILDTVRRYAARPDLPVSTL